MRKILTVTALTLGLLTQAERSTASAFRVTPVQLELSQRTASALLTLLNESDQDLRFQISVFAWSQQPNGAMKLEPTQDITFFPALVALKPGEERKVRVGTKVFATDLEKTYRIFFEELPPLTTPAKQQQGAQVRILTKMGVPIFIAPEKVRYDLAIDSAAARDGKILFSVANRGNVHFSVSGVNVTAFGSNGSKLFEKKLDGWYVLPGTPRTYEVDVPTPACSDIRKVEIEAETDMREPAMAASRAQIETQPFCKSK